MTTRTISWSAVDKETRSRAKIDALLEKHPVDHVRWVHIDRVRANDYNPNSVASTEMQLLAASIRKDGYTQPIVTVFDHAEDIFVIVDGFHRYFCCKTFKDIYDSTGGYVPIVVIDKPINERMASTIRHNRARGKHSVDGMSKMVFAMLENHWSDEEICNELGMDPEELIRLKHITGFSKLFEDKKYRKSWMTDRQIRIRKSFQESQNGNGSGNAGTGIGASSGTDQAGSTTPLPAPDQE